MKNGKAMANIRITTLLLVCLSLLGCRTTHKVVDDGSTTSSGRDSAYHYAHGSSDSAWLNVNLIDTSWHSWGGTMVIYDTSLPIDPTTGKCPIKVEYTFGGEQHNAVQNDVNYWHQKTDTIVVSTEVRDTLYIETHHTEEVTRKTPWYARWQTILGIALIALLGGAMLDYKFNPFKR